MQTTTTATVVGNPKNLTATFVDQNGNPINPTTVTFEVYTPTERINNLPGTTHTFGVDSSVSNPQVGTFICQVMQTVAGAWLCKVTCSGTLIGAAETEWRVLASRVSN